MGRQTDIEGLPLSRVSPQGVHSLLLDIESYFGTFSEITLFSLGFEVLKYE